MASYSTLRRVIIVGSGGALMRLLFLSHCAPDAPDKGEKVRAYDIVRRLSARHELHVACFARNLRELDGLRQLEARCASVYAELLKEPRALVRAAVAFAFGGCLNEFYYRSGKMRRYVRTLAAQSPFDAAVVYTLPMAQYTPPETPFVIDMQDVDSEKWFQYAHRRFPGVLYRLEARRLRKREIEVARTAHRSFFVTRAEELLFLRLAGEVPTGYMENGWDAAEHDPQQVGGLPELSGRRYIVFCGSMHYFPNVDAAVWFARHIFLELRKRDPELELFIVGRNPTRKVRALAKLPGITVTGTVPDPRPYLKDCLAAVAPLQIARGVQMKVIEGLAMGKPVLVSPEVAATFGDQIPPGVRVCRDVEEYWEALTRGDALTPEQIRSTVQQRFDGYRNLDRLLAELERIAAR